MAVRARLKLCAPNREDTPTRTNDPAGAWGRGLGYEDALADLPDMGGGVKGWCAVVFPFMASPHLLARHRISLSTKIGLLPSTTNAL
jgi:hypothetical protein